MATERETERTVQAMAGAREVGRPVIRLLGILALSVSGLASSDILSAQSTPTNAVTTPAAVVSDTPSFSFPGALLKTCPAINSSPHPPPDDIADVLSTRKRYRLVIGVSEYSSDVTLNRPYAQTTAQLIDSRLARIGFAPLPSRARNGILPYLTGKDATKANMKALLKELASITTGQDIGVVYYIGHGSVTPNHVDVSLSVYDRPVSEDEGIRVTDVVGLLTVGQHHKSIPEIPRAAIILDSCYAGNATISDGAGINSAGGLDVLTKTIRSIVVPEQIAVLSASGAGDTAQAFDLKGSGASALGALMARALDEEWDCADSDHDGVLTVNELRDYLEGRLDDARTAHLIDGRMRPSALSIDPHSFVAYSPAHWFLDGQRPQIHQLLVRSDTEVASITLPGGAAYQCPPDCRIAFSATAKGTATISIPTSPTTLGSNPQETPGVHVSNGIASLALPLTQLSKTKARKLGDVTIEVQ